MGAERAVEDGLQLPGRAAEMVRERNNVRGLQISPSPSSVRAQMGDEEIFGKELLGKFLQSSLVSFSAPIERCYQREPEMKEVCLP